MFLPLFGGPIEPPKPLIQIVTVKETAQAPSEPTIEEKIATNYYKCDETIQYIRADNAECLDKPEYRAPTQRIVAESTNTQLTTKTQARAPQDSSNTYAPANCTWYAKSKRPDLPNNLGNAATWVARAASQGFGTGSQPRVGAVGQQGNHVVYVEQVEGSKIYLSEMNYDFNGGFRYRWANASDFQYIY